MTFMQVMMLRSSVSSWHYELCICRGRSYQDIRQEEPKTMYLFQKSQLYSLDFFNDIIPTQFHKI